MATAPPNPWLAAADLFDPPPHGYLGRPVEYSLDVLDFYPWSKQRDVLAALNKTDRVAVRACHGVGKTAVAARAALWFLRTRPNSRVITTAPTWSQVEQLLWREIRGATARTPPGEFPKPTTTKLEIGVEWFAIGLSTDQPERFQGHHADHILLIVDEASGVDEKIYEAAEGFLTAEGAKLLLIGNPTRVGGQFHRAFTKERATWTTIHISVFDSPNYTGEKVPPHVARSLPRKGWAEEKAAQWGVDSPMYQVRVLGNFPRLAANAVIDLGSVENAQHRTLPPTSPIPRDRAIVACDVARFGDDETVVSTRHDRQIQIRETWTGKRPPSATATGAQQGDIDSTIGRIIHWTRILREETGADPLIVVDDSGLGGGVTDGLRNLNYIVTAFNGSETAIEADDYPNRRSELWFTMRDEVDTLDLPDDDQMAADLVAPTYRFDKHGRRVVEPKDDTKKRLKRSPDRADSVLLTLVRPRMVDVPDPPAVTPQPAWMPAGETTTFTPPVGRDLAPEM